MPTATCFASASARSRSSLVGTTEWTVLAPRCCRKHAHDRTLWSRLSGPRRVSSRRLMVARPSEHGTCALVTPSADVLARGHAERGGMPRPSPRCAFQPPGLGTTPVRPTPCRSAAARRAERSEARRAVGSNGWLGGTSSDGADDLGLFGSPTQDVTAARARGPPSATVTVYAHRRVRSPGRHAGGATRSRAQLRRNEWHTSAH